MRGEKARPGRHPIQWLRTGLLAALALPLNTNADCNRSDQFVQASGKELDDAVFLNGDIVDVESGGLADGHAIWIQNGWIKAVGNLEDFPLEAGTKQIDLHGRYVIPGLWDMHVHVADPDAVGVDMPLMFLNGVLFARDMWGDCIGERCGSWLSIDEMREVQRNVQSGVLLGPTLVEIGGFAVDGPRAGYARRGRPKKPSFLVPKTPEEGREIVHYFLDRGVDFIKPYDSLPHDVYMAMAREGKRTGLPLAGHVPKSVTISEAIEAGQRSIEHARMLPMACSRAGEDYQREYAQWASSDYPPSDDDPNVDDVNLPDWYRRILGSIDQEKCDRVLNRWSKSDTYYVPTHLTRRAEAIVEAFPHRTDSRTSYVSDSRLASWDAEARKYERLFKASSDLREDYRDYFEQGLELTGRAHDAGVKIMAGTDSGDTLIYPGASLHDELELLFEAGLSPASVLAAATSVPAQYESLSKTHGSIAAGKVAALVILEKNPLADIRQTRSIFGIYYQSRFYDRDELNSIEAEIESRVRSENGSH